MQTPTVSARKIGSGDLASRIEVLSKVVINSNGVHLTATSNTKVRVFESIGGKETPEQEIL